jgi:hypothetical protein
MRTSSSRLAQALAVLLALGTLLGTTETVSAQETTERDIMDFVNAQGTFCFTRGLLGLPGNPNECLLFVPPVPNFLGATDPDAGLSMSVDYAGLADAACDRIAGTRFCGTVQEKPLKDGRAEVYVELKTFDAITWVIDGFDFANDPVIFGTRWQEVKTGPDQGDCFFPALPALGDSLLQVRFINPKPGAPLPDLIQLLADPAEGQKVLSLALDAEAVGLLPDGTPALATTKQLARQVDGELVFTVEKVTVEPLDFLP